MNIQLENSEQSGTLIRIQIEPLDYQERIEASLRDFRKNARIPGFRPGMVPMGMVKKLYQRPIRVEEISKLVTEKLNDFISNEKLSIIGEPLPLPLSEGFDWENQDSFEFVFEIGMRPEIDLEKLREMEIPFYQISIDDSLLEKHINQLLQNFGEMEEPELVQPACRLSIKAQQVDAEGQPLEDGLSTDNISKEITPENPSLEPVIGMKKDDSFIRPLGEMIENEKEAKNLFPDLNIEDSDWKAIPFQFTIENIWNWKPAEINESLFQKLFPNDTPATEGDFRNMVRKDLSERLYLGDRDVLFFVKAREQAIELLNPEIPESFMKRWLLQLDTNLTQETLEKGWKYYEHELKWELLEGKIEHDYKLDISNEELKDFVMQNLQAKYREMGYPLPMEYLNLLTDKTMEKKEEVKKLRDQLFDRKLTQVFKTLVQLVPQEITEMEFFQMIGHNPDGEHEHEHDHEHEHEHDHEHAADQDESLIRFPNEDPETLEKDKQ